MMDGRSPFSQIDRGSSVVVRVAPASYRIREDNSALREGTSIAVIPDNPGNHDDEDSKADSRESWETF